MAKNAEKKSKKHLSLIIRVFVAILAVGLFLKGEDLGQLWNTLKQINPLVFLAAVGLYCCGQFLFVLRWRLLLKALEIDLGIGAGVKLHLLGLFYNNCLPSSVGGDLLRAWYVTKHTDDSRRFEAALSVFVDRAVGLTGMLILAGVFYWLVPVETSQLVEHGSAQAGSSGGGLLVGLLDHQFVIMGVFGGILLIVGVFACTGRGKDMIKKIFSKIVKLSVRVFSESIAAVKVYSKKPVLVAAAYLLTFASQGIGIYGFYLIGSDLGMGAALKYFYVFFPLSWIIGVIPVSIGGLGVIEGVLKEAFKSVGVISEKAAAIAVCQRLVMLVSSIPGVFIHIFGAHLPSDDTDGVD